MTFRPTPFTRRPLQGGRATALLAASALVVALCTPASADAKVIAKDSSDNLFEFDYDATDGSMPEAYSSRGLVTKSDRVDYFVYIRERPEGEVGERLVAKLQLRLIPARTKGKIDWAATERMVYDGTFTIDIDSATTPDVYVDSRARRVVLTREKGHRRATIRFLFDLGPGTDCDPSYCYQAVSRFLAE